MLFVVITTAASPGAALTMPQDHATLDGAGPDRSTLFASTPAGNALLGGASSAGCTADDVHYNQKQGTCNWDGEYNYGGSSVQGAVPGCGYQIQGWAGDTYYTVGPMCCDVVASAGFGVDDYYWCGGLGGAQLCSHDVQCNDGECSDGVCTGMSG
mmetsp:Transcript_16880/g.50839  ORF Transcript_16880/g.50839 Transcript_16880/m.50839 type:complete len:155 (+) Transcript_16880:91-555(+)